MTESTGTVEGRLYASENENVCAEHHAQQVPNGSTIVELRPEWDAANIAAEHQLAMEEIRGSEMRLSRSKYLRTHASFFEPDKPYHLEIAREPVSEIFAAEA